MMWQTRPGWLLAVAYAAVIAPSTVRGAAAPARDHPAPAAANPVGVAQNDLLGLIAAVALLVPVGLGVAFVVRLNRSHIRLRSSLENQLAERQKAEQALRESEQFYHTLVESLPQSILRKDLGGRFLFGNSRFCNELGCTLDQIQGKTDHDFFPKELADKYRRDDARVFETDQIFETIEEHVTPQGEKLFVHVLKTPLHDPSGRLIGIQGIFWDVTARVRGEEQLREQQEQLRQQNILLHEAAEAEKRALEALKQTQSRLIQAAKLAALGEMVAGVAHEINNPLSFVMNNVAVLQRDLGEMRELLDLYRQGDGVLIEHRPELQGRIVAYRDGVDMDYTLQNLPGLLHRTREGLGRIQTIVKNLRAFARLDESDLSDVNLNAGIESTLNIVLVHAKKKRVQIRTDLHELPVVACYPAKINQVITNLLTNAVDACQEGGEVAVRTQAVGDEVIIEVQDNGCGISAEARDRIFDPFFTTKPVGEGTGLGLSISYGIVQDHGGRIEVDSAPGRGARFTVHLPVHAPDGRRPALASQPQATGG